MWKSVYDFSINYIDQVLVLATGGHDCALRLAENDILWEILDKECESNELLTRLRSFYYQLDELSEELRCVVGDQKEFINKQEFEIFMN